MDLSILSDIVTEYGGRFGIAQTPVRADRFGAPLRMFKVTWKHPNRTTITCMRHSLEDATAAVIDSIKHEQLTLALVKAVG